MESRTKIWQKYYDKCAELEDKVFKTARFDVPKFQYREIIKDIRKKLKINKEDFLLDIGCANGIVERNFSGYAKRIIGLDISTKELMHAKKNNQGLSNILFCAGDAFKLPIRGNSIDKSLLYSVTMHFEEDDIKNIIAEIIKVTRNGGVIFIGDNIREYENKKGKKRSRWNKYRAYCQLNPENKSFIWLRALMFLVLKKMVLTLGKTFYNLQSNKAIMVPDPFPNISYNEDKMLEMIRELGQEGRILQQNYKLPYALIRFDILIVVEK